MDETTKINNLNNQEHSLEFLTSKIRKFVEERDWDKYHNPKDLAIGVITEASELLELFRFKSPEELEAMLKNEEKKKAISEELADVFYFVLRFADKCNLNLSAELLKKMEKNETKYPIEKAKGKNLKYNEL